jgi:hypothetical protein
MDFNQNSPLQTPLVSSASAVNKKRGKRLAVGLIVLIAIIIAVIILLANYKKSNEMNIPSFTEEERRATLYSLEATALAAPKITEEERRATVYSLKETSAAAPVLTPAERQAALDSLTQKAKK